MPHHQQGGIHGRGMTTSAGGTGIIHPQDGGNERVMEREGRKIIGREYEITGYKKHKTVGKQVELEWWINGSWMEETGESEDGNI